MPPQPNEKTLKERMGKIIRCGSCDDHDNPCWDCRDVIKKVIDLFTQDRKDHEQALNAIEQKKKDHTCEFDCVGCLANGFNACRMVMLEASKKYQANTDDVSRL